MIVNMSGLSLVTLLIGSSPPNDGSEQFVGKFASPPMLFLGHVDGHHLISVMRYPLWLDDHRTGALRLCSLYLRRAYLSVSYSRRRGRIGLGNFSWRQTCAASSSARASVGSCL